MTATACPALARCRRPVEMEHAGRFDQDEQAFARREVAREQREEFASSGRAHRQVSFQEESLRAPAQGDADFMFCGIEAEVVVYFH